MSLILVTAVLIPFLHFPEKKEEEEEKASWKGNFDFLLSFFFCFQGSTTHSRRLSSGAIVAATATLLYQKEDFQFPLSPLSLSFFLSRGAIRRKKEEEESFLEHLSSTWK